MKGKQDETEQFIREELQKEADAIEKEVRDSGEIEDASDGVIEEIRLAVHEKIEEHEKKKIYSLLSEEDRIALELGKKMQVKRKTKKRKVYLSLAAVIILVLALGMTGIGGPERVVRLMESIVGERKIMQVDSSAENAKSIEDKEEEAYEEIAKKLVTEPVRIVPCIEGMKYQTYALDESIRTAELFYTLKEEKISFYINTSYGGTSWAVDVEDNILDSWTETVNGCSIEIKEYGVNGFNKKRYSANFEYKGLEYFINGTIKKEEIITIIKNLYFF